MRFAFMINAVAETWTAKSWNGTLEIECGQDLGVDYSKIRNRKAFEKHGNRLRLTKKCFKCRILDPSSSFQITGFIRVD